MPSSYKSTLQYLLSLERHGIKPGLERISRLLKLLGDPQLKYPAVHVAGTNGKGSTSAMLSSVLNEAGMRTGLYTSPHLVKFNERIQVSGRMITGPELCEAARIVKKAAARMPGSPITFFEFTTAMAFVHFSLKEVDIAVIETGMGGRFDATNTLLPEVSVITNVNVDHTQYLGSGLKEIAFEKSGIIKPGRPVVTGEIKKAPLSVIRKRAKESSSSLYVLNRDFSVQIAPSSLSYSGLELELNGLRLGLSGPHQAMNAGLSLAAIEALRQRGFQIPVSAIRAGLRKAAWPGRFETISKKPLVIIDGAHNPAGARTLANALKDLSYKRLILVLGIMADKDIDAILKELIPLCDEAIATEPRMERSAAAAMLAEKIRAFGKPALEVRRVKDACKEAIQRAGKNDCVCVTGSLFTVGEARAFLVKPRS